MAETVTLTNTAQIGMPTVYANVNTGPEVPNYQVVKTLFTNMVFDAITGSSTTTTTVTMTLSSRAMVQVTPNLSTVTVGVVKSLTGFVITVKGTDTAAGTMDVEVTDFV